MGTEHFDGKAATWDQDPEKVEQAREVAEAVAATVPLSRDVRLLEYGAGTALVSQVLADRVGPVTLVDNSAGMQQVMREKIAAGVLPADARVWDLDLESQPAPDERFDLVVGSMVLHHVQALDTVLGAFRELLADGGYLCLADLDREDGSFHGEEFHGHHGFDRGMLAKALRGAGFAEVSVEDLTELVREGTAYPVFLATARR
jgi:predicted TPR repeat methyltransferase